MKWTKFDPENPPRAKVLFRMDYEDEIVYCMGFHVYNLCGVHISKNEFMYYYDKEMQKYNAHWIYPQDLEMPE